MTKLAGQEEHNTCPISPPLHLQLLHETRMKLEFSRFHTIIGVVVDGSQVRKNRKI